MVGHPADIGPGNSSEATPEGAAASSGPDPHAPEPSRAAITAVSGCGLFSGIVFLGCFPIVVLAGAIAIWAVPLSRLAGRDVQRAEALLDDVAAAQERLRAATGAYAAAPPCPEATPDEPVPFPGSCPAQWKELGLPWTGISCRVWVETPAPGRFVATAECFDGGLTTTWIATERSGPAPAAPR